MKKISIDELLRISDSKRFYEALDQYIEQRGIVLPDSLGANDSSESSLDFILRNTQS